MESPIGVRKVTEYYHYLFPADFFFPGHRHRVWEINIVTRGTLEVTYDDTIITLNENRMMIFEPEVFHRNRVLSRDGVELYVFQFLTDDIPQYRKARVYPLFENHKALLTLLTEEAEKYALPLEHGSCTSRTFNYQTEKLLELLLIKFVLENENIIYSAKNAEATIHHQAIGFMKENLRKNITIQDIATHCGVSPTRLKNILRSYTGQGIIEHFTDMKLMEAKKLLRQGKSIKEVSTLLGYSSQAYFSVCFKKNTGISPLKYKSSNPDLI